MKGGSAIYITFSVKEFALTHYFSRGQILQSFNICECVRSIINFHPQNQDVDFNMLEGKYPQIYTVCHVWTFDFQLFSDVRYASFQHKFQ